MFMHEFTMKRPLEQLFFSGNHFDKYNEIKSDLLIGDRERVIPEYTILIPTFKRPEYLRAALKSVLEQDIKGVGYDILIIDNDCDLLSSTLAMLSEINVPNLYYYQNENNLGATGNWNRGFLLARTKWVIVLHDDDLLYPYTLRAAVRAIKKLDRGNLGAVMGQINSFNGFDDMITEPRRTTGSKREKILKNRAPKRSLKRLQLGLFDGPFSPTCGALFNRSAVLEMGGYGEDYKSDDMLFLYALSEKYDCFSLKETWGKYRFAVNDTLNEETQALLMNENIMLNDYFLAYKQKGILAALDRKYRRKHPYMVGIYPLMGLVQPIHQEEFVLKYFPDWAAYHPSPKEEADFRRRLKALALYNLIIDFVFAQRYNSFS